MTAGPGALALAKQNETGGRTDGRTGGRIVILSEAKSLPRANKRGDLKPVGSEIPRCARDDSVIRPPDRLTARPSDRPSARPPAATAPLPRSAEVRRCRP